MRAARTSCFLLALFAVQILGVQAQSTDDASASEPFTAKIEGTWQLTDVNVRGRPSSTDNYGRSVFAKDQWTMQTRNGDHIFELTDVNVKADRTEITCVEHEGKRSFVALARLNDDQLTIARGLNWTRDANGLAAIPSPTSMEPAPDTLVYTFARSAPEVSERPKLVVRLTDESRGQPETLVDQTIAVHYGGGFDYALPERKGPQRDDLTLPGTAIEGTIRTSDDGDSRVKIAIRITAEIALETPETQAIQSQSFFIETTLPEGVATRRVKCGPNIWCEVSVL